MLAYNNANQDFATTALWRRMQSAEYERLRSAYDAAQRDPSSSRSMNPPPAPARVRTSVPEHELHALTPEAKRSLLWARHVGQSAHNALVR